MTAIGPGASVDGPGDFSVAIAGTGEQLTIRADGEALWVGHLSLKQVAKGASETLVRELWKDGVSEDVRAVALTRLYDRMDLDAAVESLEGMEGAPVALAAMTVSDDDAARAIALLRVFDDADEPQRLRALEVLILVGFDLSRKRFWKR